MCVCHCCAGVRQDWGNQSMGGDVAEDQHGGAVIRYQQGSINPRQGFFLHKFLVCGMDLIWAPFSSCLTFQGDEIKVSTRP